MKFTAHFIDGQWQPASGADVIRLTNPVTGDPADTVRNGSSSDVDKAVRAARAALADWSQWSAAARADRLEHVCRDIERQTDTFADAMAEELGCPLWFGRQFQVPMPCRNLTEAITFIRNARFTEEAGTSLILREPIGVVAAITPWNAPLHQIVAKVGAALAAGCTIVLKPSELAPRTAFHFAEIMASAGIPPGAFNLVFGGANEVGVPLVVHPEVDIVSFTGSVGAGRRVGEAAGREIKKVVMELGGKSASILLDDAPLERAVETVLAQCFSNSGQVCVAQSRMLVPRERLNEIESLCADKAGAWIVGDPRSPTTRLGPVANGNQYERVHRYIATGEATGARLIAGGTDRPKDCERGYYVQPTIFSEVTPDMEIAREEIFGPVLSVMPYNDLDEAVAIANATDYGLSGGVWSADREKAAGIARRVRTGQVSLNGAPQNFATPFGGYRLSGFGRENGRFGVEEFLQYRVIHGAAGGRPA